MDQLPVQITIALLSLGVLLLIAVFGLFRTLRYRLFIEPYYPRVIKLDHMRADSLKLLLSTLEPPYALEIAIHQLGNDLHYYIVVPAIQVKKVAAHLPASAEVVDDYAVYHPGGSTLVYHVAPGESVHMDGSAAEPISLTAALESFTHVDLSKVNEIGESVVIQLVVKKRTRRGFSANCRAIVSAPTGAQAGEIARALIGSFPSNFIVREAVEPDVLYEATFRQFTKERESVWRL